MSISSLSHSFPEAEFAPSGLATSSLSDRVYNPSASPSSMSLVRRITLLLGLLTSPRGVMAQIQQFELSQGSSSLAITGEGNFRSLAASSSDVMAVWNQGEIQQPPAIVVNTIDVDDKGQLSYPSGRTKKQVSKIGDFDLGHPSIAFVDGLYRIIWQAVPIQSTSGQHFWSSSFCTSEPACSSLTNSYIGIKGGEVTAGYQQAGITPLPNKRFALAWPDNDGSMDRIVTQIFSSDNKIFTPYRQISNPTDDASVVGTTPERLRAIAMAPSAPIDVKPFSYDYSVIWIDRHPGNKIATLHFRALSLAVDQTIAFNSDVKEVADRHIVDGVEGLPAVIGTGQEYSVFFRNDSKAILRQRFDLAGNRIGGSVTAVDTSTYRPDYFSVLPWYEGYASFWSTEGSNTTKASYRLQDNKLAGGPVEIPLGFEIRSKIDLAKTQNDIVGLWKSTSGFRIQTFRWSAIPTLPPTPIPTPAPTPISVTGMPTPPPASTPQPTPMSTSTVKSVEASGTNAEGLSTKDIVAIALPVSMAGLIGLVGCVGWIVNNVLIKKTENENNLLDRITLRIKTNEEEIQNKFNECLWTDDSQRTAMRNGLRAIKKGRGQIDSAVIIRKATGWHRYIPFYAGKLRNRGTETMNNGLNEVDQGIEEVRASVGGLNVVDTKHYYINDRRENIQRQLNNIRAVIRQPEKEYLQSIDWTLPPAAPTAQSSGNSSPLTKDRSKRKRRKKSTTTK